MSSQLQNLSSEFNSLITQYTDTYQKYINLINSEDTSLITVPDYSFVGKSNINVLNNSNIDACQTSCVSNTSCSGATFNNNSNSCTLSSGTGNMVFTPQSTAIVQQALYYSFQLQQINTQLMNINQQIMTISKNSYGDFKQNQQQNQQQAQILENNYKTLSQERIQIDEIVNKFQTLNTAYENGNIIITTNYYIYIILLFTVIFLVFILIKYSLPQQQRGGGNDFKFNINHLLIFSFLGFIIVFNSAIKK
jgi:hypothetical protein